MVISSNSDGSDQQRRVVVHNVVVVVVVVVVIVVVVSAILNTFYILYFVYEIYFSLCKCILFQIFLVVLLLFSANHCKIQILVPRL